MSTKNCMVKHYKHFLHRVHEQFTGCHFLIAILKPLMFVNYFNSVRTKYRILESKNQRHVEMKNLNHLASY